MPDFEISEIRSKRELQPGNIEYLIHWSGYDTSDDTWETRDNLIADGYEEPIVAYEDDGKSSDGKSSDGASEEDEDAQEDNGKEETIKVLASGTKNSQKSANKRNRSRSRTREVDNSTPKPKVDNSTSKTKTDESSQGSPTTEPKVVVRHSTSAQNTQQTEGGQLPLAVFYLAASFTFAFRVAKDSNLSILSNPDYKIIVQGAGFLEVVPPLAALFYVYQVCEPKPFPMRICAALLWIAVVSFFQNSFDVNPEFSQMFTKEQLLWGPTALWQVLFAIALNIELSQATQFAVLVLSAAFSYAIHNYIAVVTAFDVSMLTVCAGGFTFLLSVVQLIRTQSHGRVFDFCAASIGLALILVDLFALAGKIPQLHDKPKLVELGQLDDEVLKVNLNWIGYVVARWTMCVCMAHSAKVVSSAPTKSD